ncbi:hypothetical protein GBA52_021698 [Prunus armeniaca]|nr:hypothetical protein GBA52_021698 [Prunus armeniaca]
MKNRIESAVATAEIPVEIKKQHKGFSEWNLKVAKNDHQSIVQLRVSSEISNAPFILLLDCDMYANNADSIREALCFFLDEKYGPEIAYVQHPQGYNNLTKDDIYGNECFVINAG